MEQKINLIRDVLFFFCGFFAVLGIWSMCIYTESLENISKDIIVLKMNDVKNDPKDFELKLKIFQSENDFLKKKCENLDLENKILLEQISILKK